jgi:superfamily II DNA/RNA helicase
MTATVYTISDNIPINLKEVKGITLLVTVPAAFSGTCTNICVPAISDNAARIKEAGADLILIVSEDQPHAIKKWVEHARWNIEKIAFASDFGKFEVKGLVGKLSDEDGKKDLIPRIEDRIAKKERVLVTTLTKRMAEDLSKYLEEEKKLKVKYLHSDVQTLDRIKILTGLRRGEFDVLVGVNLLREGLDLPEVSLVAILDADKEGFLRSDTSLIQTIGRAARNAEGEVLMYADTITGSIKRACEETERRRIIQLAYNKKHNITPKTIIKAITNILPTETLAIELTALPKSKKAKKDLIAQKEQEMKEAAKRLDFELAAILRDELLILQKETKKTEKEEKKKG